MANWVKEITDLRIAALEIEHGYYLELDELLSLFDTADHAYQRICDENHRLFETAAGSSHNHQAWKGGYMAHLLEVLNIACQQYNWMSRARKLPFTLADALQVLFLHDIEKPWKYADRAADTPLGGGFWTLPLKTKADRKNFRTAVIQHYGLSHLTAEQDNALEYVEGVRDADYTPGERTMGELAAFCHSCDILSARMWHDKGKDVNLGSSRWE